MSDAAVVGEGHVDLVTMGCRWVLDVSALDDAEAREMTDRWRRCHELAPADVLARGRWSDAVAADGEVLVLVGGTPLRLAGPGAAIWRAAGRGRPVGELVDEVVAELGEHPDAEPIVREAARLLLRHRALRRVLA